MAKGFRIAARALRQLGAELITSDEIALNELIKNSLDAKATKVIIEISNPFSKSCSALIQSFKDKSLSGSDIAALKHTIKSLFFSAIIEEADSNIKAKIEKYVESKTSFDSIGLIKEIYDLFSKIIISDDGHGMGATQLRDNFLVIGTPGKWVEKQSQSGQPLMGEKGVGRLSMMRLGNSATLDSGVVDSKSINRISFDWKLFDDPNLFLEDIDVDVQENFELKEVDKSGTTIIINNLNSYWSEIKTKEFINEYLRRLQNPFSQHEKFPIIVKFNGKRLPIPGIYSWLRKEANFYAKITYCPDSDTGEIIKRKLRWRGKDSWETRSWSFEDIFRQVDTSTELLKALGGFELDVLWFNRRDLSRNSIDKSSSELRSELNLWCGGYAIYRDNFRIGLTGSLEDDWLKVDQGSLKSSGFAFNRYQTVGSLSISQKKNPKLIDAANREKLVGCDELTLLKELLTEVVNKDLKSHIEFFKEMSFKDSVEKVTAEETLADAKRKLRKAGVNAGKLSKVIPKDHLPVMKEIQHVLKTQQENIRKYETAVKLSREQRIEVLELAGLGMVVEKVVHELARLTASTVENLSKLEEADVNDSRSDVIRIIREQINVTNKRIRSVDSLSPSGRNRKALVDLPNLVSLVIKGFKGRCDRHDINITFTVDELEPIKSFKVNVVEGLIALVLENLLNNAVYWLQQSLKEGAKKREIFINLDSSTSVLTVRDNGPGIDPSHREQIFKAYFTNRKGKGLGLFICHEIAEYHQCSIYLENNPEEDGRLRTFVLELPKNKR